MHSPYLVYFWTNLHKILAPCLKSNFMTTLFSTFLHSQEDLMSHAQYTWSSFGSMPKIKFYDHLTFYLSSLQKSVDKCANPGGRGEGGGGQKPP